MSSQIQTRMIDTESNGQTPKITNSRYPSLKILQVRPTLQRCHSTSETGEYFMFYFQRQTTLFLEMVFSLDFTLFYKSEILQPESRTEGWFQGETAKNFREANRLYITTGGGREVYWRSLPNDGKFAADLLGMVGTFWRADTDWSAASATGEEKKTPLCCTWWLTCLTIGRCSWKWSEKSDKACSAQRVGRSSAGGFPGQYQKRLPSDESSLAHPVL